MKKLLTPLLLIAALWACNHHKLAGNRNFNNPVEADEHRPRATDEKLELNNGVKWKVDLSTNDNVNEMEVILKKFDSGNDKSLSAYKKAQTDLQQGINKMIAECKMTGPDHQALHKWLEPLMTRVTKLKQASTRPDAAEALNAIHAQVNLYSQYFEL